MDNIGRKGCKLNSHCPIPFRKTILVALGKVRFRRVIAPIKNIFKITKIKCLFVEGGGG